MDDQITAEVKNVIFTFVILIKSKHLLMLKLVKF